MDVLVENSNLGEMPCEKERTGNISTTVTLNCKDHAWSVVRIGSERLFNELPLMAGTS